MTDVPTAKTQSQQTVEELLTSIRKAIHGDALFDGAGGSGTDADKPLVSGSMREMRVRMDTPGDGLRGPVASRSGDFMDLGKTVKKMDKPAVSFNPRASNRPATGFASILGGEARLDEALAKLAEAGLDERNGRQPPPMTKPERASSPANAHSRDAGPGQPAPAAVAAQDITDGVDADPYADDIASEYYTGSQMDGDPEPLEATGGEMAASLDEVAAQYVAPGGGEPAGTGDEPRAHGGLLSPSSADAASNAFHRLADTIVSRSSGGERSIEDITRELLHPMLQAWLDEHLPRIVERLVREEIERVARWQGRS